MDPGPLLVQLQCLTAWGIAHLEDPGDCTTIGKVPHTLAALRDLSVPATPAPEALRVLAAELAEIGEQLRNIDPRCGWCNDLECELVEVGMALEEAAHEPPN